MTPPRDDPELRGPAQLAPPRVPVVRLNRRVLYVVGAALVLVFVAGLVALRAQGSRLAQDGNSARASQLPPAGERWFDKVPDREPSAQPAFRSSTPAPAKAVSDPEGEAQRQEGALRAAMAAPIGAVAFEARPLTARGSGSERSVAGIGAAPATAGSILPAAALAAAQAVTAGLPPAPRPAAPPMERPEVVPASLRGPTSPYEVKAGTIIPAVLLTGVNSDLPGQLIAQVREPVFDTETGQHLLVPQGARLIGLYDHQVVYGQERVLITWKRVIFPNASSLSLKDGMPGTDATGAAGFQDQVNHHLVRVFGNALLLSVISAGVQLSQIPDFGRGFGGPTAGNVLGASVGQQLGQTSADLIRRGMGIAPTIEIRPGYAFNVMVTQDLVFPGPYDDTGHP
ncbi:MAG TPA: TrbI/VirB10 family protein [Gemmatimonadales bacterium]|nr:TrbI/VirB10 family protein [Gemmatimonadales bacterium]